MVKDEDMEEMTHHQFSTGFFALGLAEQFACV